MTAMDWPELLAEFEAHHNSRRIVRLPVAVACYDANPWDPEIRCTNPSGHRGLHEHVLTGGDIERWDDRCHWPGDSCEPCTNPRGRAA